MIEIEEGSLGTLEQDVIAAENTTVQQDDGVGDKGFEIIARGTVFLQNLLEGEGFGPERFEDLVVFFNLELEFLLEQLGVHQVNDTQAGAGRLVAVGRTNPAFGGADLIFALE